MSPRRRMLLAATLLAAVWLGGGLLHIPGGEVGVLIRHGQPQGAALAPGWHWLADWPRLRVVRLPGPGLRSLQVAGEWLCADGGLVQLDLSLEYLVTAPTRYLLAAPEPLLLLRSAVQSAAVAALATLQSGEILGEGNPSVQAVVQSTIREMVGALDMGVEVVAVRGGMPAPPAELAAAVSDVQVARTDSQRFLHEAERDAQRLLATAEATSAQLLREAANVATQRLTAVQARAARLAALREQFRQAPQQLAQRLYYEQIGQTLAEAKVVLLSSPPHNGSHGSGVKLHLSEQKR